MRAPTLIERIRAATADPAIVAQARAARAMVAEWMPGADYRLPGCGTLERLCVRIADGMTAEQAAAREYLYRWNLPLRQWINFAETDKPGCSHSCRSMTGAWPVPHLIGL